MIVKACPPGGAVDEPGAHQAAQAHSSPEFFQRHLVGQAFEPFPIDGGGRLMFQDIAGASLEFVSLSGVPDDHLAAACRAVVEGIIQEWNVGRIKSSQTTVGDYLKREFGRTLSPGASAESLGASLGLLGSGFRYLRDESGPRPVDMPNPLLMMTDEALAAELPIDAVVGLAHGDLHTENVLVPKAYGAYQTTNFKLVDLSTFEPDAPMTRDPVTLMMSVVAPSVHDLRADEQNALLSFLLEPWRQPPRLSALFGQTLEAIYRAGNEAIKSVQLGDWRSQYLLSVIATALQFVSFTGMPEESRWWFFRLAGQASGAFLRQHNRYHPREAVTIRRPLHWSQMAFPAAGATIPALDEASLDSLAAILGGVAAEVLRDTYSEMVDSPGATTPSHWHDLRAVIRAVDQDVGAWGGFASPMLYAERLAHKAPGGAGLRLHQWVTDTGSKYLYPDEQIRGLCSAVTRRFGGEPATSSGLSVRESASGSDNSGVMKAVPHTDFSPGGFAVLAPLPDSATLPSESAVTVPRPIHVLPQRNPAFTGRRDLLAQLEATLRTSREVSVVPQALHGFGGVGKTQLAIEYAYRHLSEYPLVWWMNADSAGQVRASLAQMAQRLGTPVELDAKVTTALVLEALSTSFFPWLLIYDNVENPEALSGLMPSTGVGHVIVTSRNASAWSARGKALEVDVFERAESIELLRRHGRGIAEADADRLADKLGDLPLALEQAGNWHSATGMPVSEYLELFDANVEDLLSEGKPIDYPQTVYAYLKLAVHRLRDEHPAAAELLELFAFLGPEPVSVTLLRAGRSGGLSDSLRQALDRPIDLNRAIKAIRELGLARVDDRQRIQVHRLTQRVLRDELIDERRQQSRRNAQGLLAAANPGYPDERVNWPVLEEIAPHVEAARLIDAVEENARMVVVDQTRYFLIIGDYESSQHLGEVALKRWDEEIEAGRLDRDDEATLLVQRHLANAYRMLGRTSRARRLNTDSFERMRLSPKFGENHEHTLFTANGLGVDLRLEGHMADALRRDEENVARHLRVRGADDEMTWRAQKNLAVSLRHLGRFAEAAQVDEEMLAKYRAEAGDGDARTLHSVENLARDYYGLGKYRQALDLLRTAVPKYRELFGLRHRDLLLATRTLTMALRKNGFLADARDNARQNYHDHFTRFGATHEHTLAAKSSYALVLRSCGSAELNEARTLLREAADVYREVFSDDHPLSLAAKVNLAVALRAAGDREEARRLDENALAKLTAQLGEKHPYTLAAATNLAEDKFLAGETIEAAKLSWTTFQRSVEARGSEHPDTLAVAVNAALNKIATGDEAGGQVLFDQVCKTISNVLGANHPATLDAIRGQRAECDIEAPPT
ncbi:FxSxx-COOH system tetratricopeptide repeat protein [Actinoplanes sp. HUAS TT8]|uniref:FxSxx-COOH system tetratricopeptide repeat protein n=1 Tax=Actinoplanes sp. HUAS TT8 TaxID=3447453 RepID=UPI003F524B5F